MTHTFDEIVDVKTELQFSLQTISLKDSAYSTNGVEEKRLRIDIAVIREAIQEKGIIVEWISKESQIADVLTKQGADDKLLLKALKERHLYRISRYHTVYIVNILLLKIKRKDRREMT